MGVSFTKYLNFRFDERIIVKPEVKRVLSFIQGGIERTKFLILGRRVLVRCSLKRVCRGVGSRTDLEWVPVVCWTNTWLTELEDPLPLIDLILWSSLTLSHSWSVTTGQSRTNLRFCHRRFLLNRVLFGHPTRLKTGLLSHLSSNTPCTSLTLDQYNNKSLTLKTTTFCLIRHLDYRHIYYSQLCHFISYSSVWWSQWKKRS